MTTPKTFVSPSPGVSSADSLLSAENLNTHTTAITELQGGRNTVFGTAAPSGTVPALRGDVCWSTTPTASNPPGWICVTAGTPGVWKAMANLAA